MIGIKQLASIYHGYNTGYTVCIVVYSQLYNRHKLASIRYNTGYTVCIVLYSQLHDRLKLGSIYLLGTNFVQYWLHCMYTHSYMILMPYSTIQYQYLLGTILVTICMLNTRGYVICIMQLQYLLGTILIALYVLYTQYSWLHNMHNVASNKSWRHPDSHYQTLHKILRFQGYLR